MNLSTAVRILTDAAPTDPVARSLCDQLAAANARPTSCDDYGTLADRAVSYAEAIEDDRALADFLATPGHGGWKSGEERAADPTSHKLWPGNRARRGDRS